MLLVYQIVLTKTFCSLWCHMVWSARVHQQHWWSKSKNLIYKKNSSSIEFAIEQRLWRGGSKVFKNTSQVRYHYIPYMVIALRTQIAISISCEVICRRNCIRTVSLIVTFVQVSLQRSCILIEYIKKKKIFPMVDNKL